MAIKQEEMKVWSINDGYLCGAGAYMNNYAEVEIVIVRRKQENIQKRTIWMDFPEGRAGAGKNWKND